MVDVRVVRAFLSKGTRMEPGQVVAVDPATAVELVQNGKAEMAGTAPAVSGPMTTESAPVLTKGKRTKTGATA
jgi:hypothetical protein